MVSIKMFKDGPRFVVIYEGLTECDEVSLMAKLSEQCAEMIKKSCAEAPAPDITPSISEGNNVESARLVTDYKNRFVSVEKDAIVKYCEKWSTPDIKNFLTKIEEDVSEKSRTKLLTQFKVETWKDILSLPDDKVRAVLANAIYLVKKNSL